MMKKITIIFIESEDFSSQTFYFLAADWAAIWNKSCLIIDTLNIGDDLQTYLNIGDTV